MHVSLTMDRCISFYKALSVIISRKAFRQIINSVFSIISVINVFLIGFLSTVEYVYLYYHL